MLVLKPKSSAVKNEMIKFHVLFNHEGFDKIVRVIKDYIKLKVQTVEGLEIYINDKIGEITNMQRIEISIIGFIICEVKNGKC